MQIKPIVLQIQMISMTIFTLKKSKVIKWGYDCRQFNALTLPL